MSNVTVSQLGDIELRVCSTTGVALCQAAQRPGPFAKAAAMAKAAENGPSLVKSAQS